jgi:tRNA threonylcarbamoyl adenosine modification protein (Sua5/YciO/YrdC/YwlC family)
MSQFFIIHPENPQPRLIKQAVKMIKDGGVIVYPTDSGYAIGCQLADKGAQDRIRQLRHLDDKHHFTLVCRDLSELSTYAMVDNYAFRLLKANTPGPYTFILKATPEVPKRLLEPKRKTIGIRVPESKIVEALLKEMDEPLMSASLILPDQDFPFANAEDIHQILCSKVNLIIDGGPCRVTPTTVVDLVDGTPKVLRVGRGDPSVFE